MPRPNMDRISQILGAVRDLAIDYHTETGKPLGITGEVAEFEASRLLGLEMCEARQSGYEAERVRDDGPTRVQIKGRRILNPSKRGQRVGTIQVDKDWDSVVLVLLDEEFRPTVIYEAQRAAIEKALAAPGSKARNERGSLSIEKYKSIGTLVWSK